MKSFIASLALVSVAEARVSTKCLACKYQDSAASFLYSYSYCKETNECLADQWNYINKWCESKWVPGWMLNIDTDCEAQVVIGACMPFVSVEGYSREVRQSNLPAGGQCTISIDATQAMGRIQFDKAVGLGVLFNDYDVGEPITIPKGEIQEITIYNGKTSQPISIDIVTSGATTLAAGAAALVASYLY